MGEFVSYFSGFLLMLIFIILIVSMGFMFKTSSAGDALAPLLGIQGEKIHVSMNDFVVIKFAKDFFRGFFLISNPGYIFII